jgi:hypothetical protein
MPSELYGSKFDSDLCEVKLTCDAAEVNSSYVNVWCYLGCIARLWLHLYTLFIVLMSCNTSQQ